jgi:hypothetical protein
VSVYEPNKAKEYRRQSKQARDVAKWISLLDVNQQLLESAQHLETVAEIEERRMRKTAPTQSPQPEARFPISAYGIHKLNI